MRFRGHRFGVCTCIVLGDFVLEASPEERLVLPGALRVRQTTPFDEKFGADAGVGATRRGLMRDEALRFTILLHELLGEFLFTVGHLYLSIGIYRLFNYGLLTLKLKKIFRISYDLRENSDVNTYSIK